MSDLWESWVEEDTARKLMRKGPLGSVERENLKRGTLKRESLLPELEETTRNEASQ